MANIMDVLQGHNRAFNSHDAAKVASFYAEDCVQENAASGEVVRGRAGVKTSMEGTFAANPDVKVEINNAFTSGNWSASELVMNGTNTGRGLTGGPPTGKSFSVRLCRIAEYDGGLIKRTTIYLDMSTLLKQLGLTPPAP